MSADTSAKSFWDYLLTDTESYALLSKSAAAVESIWVNYFFTVSMPSVYVLYKT